MNMYVSFHGCRCICVMCGGQRLLPVSFFFLPLLDLELTDLGESSSGFLLFSAKIINQLLKMPEFLCGCREPKL